MKRLLLIPFIFVACLVPVVVGVGKINEAAILPPGFNSKNGDCNHDKTRIDQLRLFYKYRGLYDYRRYHHLYLYEKNIKNKTNDFDHHSGSVVFLNYQEETLHLMCCGKPRRWEQFGGGKESEEFNKRWNKNEERSSNELNVKRPAPGNYYRTFGCFMANGSYHYFNVFTRPGIKTDFPVSFPERENIVDKGTFWRCYIRINKAKDNCYQAPYVYSWISPPLNGKKENPEPTTIPKDNKMIDVTEPIYEGGIIPCYKKRSWDTCTNPYVYSYVTLTVKEKLEDKHAGLYECVVTDRNGLSSSYRYENLNGSDVLHIEKPGGRRFGGFVVVHIRSPIYTFIPIIALVLIFLVTILCVWACPDNMEEYEQQLKETAEMRRIEKQNAGIQQDEAPLATPSTTNSPDPSKPAAVIPDGTESMMQQMTSSSPEVKRKASKKTTTTKGEKAEKGEDLEQSVHSSTHVAQHKKKKKHHPKP